MLFGARRTSHCRATRLISLILQAPPLTLSHPPMSQLSRCRSRLLKLPSPSSPPLVAGNRHHDLPGLLLARRRLQSSSTRIQIRPVPSRETQRAIDRVEVVLHKLESRSCVSSSKIQLALRGLQQQEAPVRIGGARAQPFYCFSFLFLYTQLFFGG